MVIKVPHVSIGADMRILYDIPREVEFASYKKMW